MNPEFLTEGVAVSDFMRPDRIVIGGNDDRCIELQRRVYESFAETPVLVTNNKTAEMIKYTSNSVLATMISFSNEIGNLCSALGNVDVAQVMRGVHLARYFSLVLDDGRRVQAPISSFLWAGCGYGGSCLPKDTKALSAHGRAHGMAMPLLDAVINTNLAQPERMIALAKKHHPSLRGVRVALLGLAFKEDTDDMRESPSIPIARSLLAQGASVVGYDPIARESARAALPPEVALVHSLEAALDGAEIAMIITRWHEFERVPALLATRAAPPLVVDGRRVIDAASVARYEGIGR
jgi:UDPglucose 6-dehydrogenase/GDP-mannose 6-dehydrogenase